MGQVHPEFVSVKVAGEMVGLSTWIIKKRCDAGLIEAHYEGRRRVVDVASLRSYIKSLPSERPQVEGVPA